MHFRQLAYALFAIFCANDAYGVTLFELKPVVQAIGDNMLKISASVESQPKTEELRHSGTFVMMEGDKVTVRFQILPTKDENGRTTFTATIHEKLIDSVAIEISETRQRDEGIVGAGTIYRYANRSLFECDFDFAISEQTNTTKSTTLPQAK